MAQGGTPHHTHLPYGVAIRDSIAGGDLAKMKQVRDQTEKHLSESGDIAAALEVLKTEIAKAEAKGA